MTVQLVPACQPILLGLDVPDLPSQPQLHGLSADPIAWQRWRADWHRALGVKPLDGTAGYCVALRDLRQAGLIDALIDASVDEDLQHAPLEDAGIALLIDGRLVARPNCCIDLGEAVSAWDGFIRRTPDSWELIWMGHPWIMGRVAGELAEFTTQSEEPALKAVATAPIHLLEAALLSARREQAEFALQLEVRLSDRSAGNARESALRIAGVDVAHE